MIFWFRIDGVIGNTGYGVIEPLIGLSPRPIDQWPDVDLLGLFYMQVDPIFLFYYEQSKRMKIEK